MGKCRVTREMDTITVREIIEQWIESITKQVLLDVTEQQRSWENLARTVAREALAPVGPGSVDVSLN